MLGSEIVFVVHITAFLPVVSDFGNFSYTPIRFLLLAGAKAEPWRHTMEKNAL
jgi:hypothetical protein